MDRLGFLINPKRNLNYRLSRKLTTYGVAHNEYRNIEQNKVKIDNL